jgi:TonB-linked SusC/RagA family outer membrane protein
MNEVFNESRSAQLKKNKMKKVHSVVFFLGVLALSLHSGFASPQDTGNDREQRITINKKNTSVKQVLRELERKTGYTFIYNDALIDVKRKVDISVSEMPLGEVLDHLFSNYPVTYKTVEKNILLIPVDKKEASPEAQQGKITVTGKVTDTKGNPLPGVNIYEKNNPGNGVISDQNGHYTIKLNDPNTILTFSFVGYKKKDIPVAGKEQIDVVLEETAMTLDEVVTIGYGQRKKINLTGAVGVISSKDLQNKVASNTSQILQGLSPNLNIYLKDGKIDRDASINIRGITSINGGGPLVLIDGVEGNIGRLNPDDIESISILKDAASASIYGARAAFGVVLITTKKAREGQVHVNYNFDYGVSSPTIHTDRFITNGLEWARLSDKLSYVLGSSTYLGYGEEDYEYLEARQKDPSLPPVLIKYVNGAERYIHYGNTDWWNTLFSNNQTSQNHNFSISGGSEKVNFYLSGKYYTREGIYKIKPDILTNKTLHTNIKAKPFKWLEIGNTINIFNRKYDYPTTITRRVNGDYNYQKWNVFFVHASPLYLPHNPDGTIMINPAYNNRAIGDGSIGSLISGKCNGEDKDFEVFYALPVVIHVLKGLDVNLSYNFRKRRVDQWVRLISPEHTNQPGGEGVELFKPEAQTYKEIGKNYFYNALNAYATYKFSPWQDHHFEILAGFNQEYNYYKRNVTMRNGNISEVLNSFNLATGDNFYISSYESEWATRSGFFRVNYTYANKYLFEVNGRIDASSKFPAGNRTVFVPSFSAGWKMDHEKFWDGIRSYVNTFKPRVSYGTLGNQNVSNYGYLSTLDVAQGNYIVGQLRSDYLTTPPPVSGNYTWEKVRVLDAGADITFLDNRLSFTFDWYKRQTLNMLTLGKKLPSVFGAREPKENAADLETKGYEIILGWKDRVDLGPHPFTYNVTFTLGDSRSFITRFDNPNGDINQYYVGKEIGEIWGYHIEGFFQSDYDYLDHADQILVNSRIRNNYVINHPVAGDLKFADLDHDGKITPGQQTLDDHGDLIRIGNSQARYNYSVSMNIGYLGFDLNIFGQGIMHRDWVVPQDASLYWGPFARPYQSFIPRSIEGMTWTPENPNTYFPRLAPYAERSDDHHRGYEGSQLGVHSDRYLENAAYFRLKNLTLGYSLPQELLNKIHCQKLRVYVTGVNILTFTPIYKHNPDRTVDPEQLGTLNAYPFNKTYLCGVNVTF